MSELSAFAEALGIETKGQIDPLRQELAVMRETIHRQAEQLSALKAVIADRPAPVSREELGGMVSAAVEKAVGKIEPIKGDKGDSLKTEDVEPLITRLVGETVEKAVGKIEPIKGDKGDSLKPEDVEPLITRLVGETVEKAVGAIEPIKGDKGDSIKADDVLPMIEALVGETVEKAVGKIEPIKGDKGDSLKPEDVEPLIERLVGDKVEKAVGSLELPKGDKGDSVKPEDLAPMVQALVGETVEKAVGSLELPKGDDGVGISKIMRNDKREVVIVKSNGETENLGVLDGEAGLGFDDYDMAWDGHRGFSFVLRRGDRIKKWDFSLPIPLFVGPYTEGMQCEAGDVVQQGGHLWIAKSAGDGMPGRDRDQWRQMMRRPNPPSGSSRPPVKLKHEGQGEEAES